MNHDFEDQDAKMEREFEQLIQQFFLDEKFNEDELDLLFKLWWLANECRSIINFPTRLKRLRKEVYDGAARVSEEEFTETRQTLMETSGWKNLDQAEREQIETAMFRVEVSEENLNS